MIARLFTPFRIALLLGLILSVLRFVGCGPLERLDMRAIDYRFELRGVQPASPEIVIVAIDDASVEQLGRWPWSRRTIAKLVDRLTDADAKVIGFDMVQSEPTADLNLDGLREHVEGVDDRTWAAIRSALGKGAGEDDMLINAVRASGRVVLGYYFDFSATGAQRNNVRVLEYNAVRPSKDGKGERKVREVQLAKANLPDLTAAAHELGYFNFHPDDDGEYRRVPLALRYGNTVAAPLSVAVLRAYRPNTMLKIVFDEYGVETVRIGNVEAPVDRDGQMLINYRGPGRTFRHVSAADVLAGKVPAETLRGKIVIVGVTAVAVADVRVTPVDGQFPGVEIHANVIDNFLHNDFIAQPWWLDLIEIAIILLAVLILGVVLHYVRGVGGVLVVAALVASYLAGSQWFFVTYGLPLGFVYPLSAIGLAYIGIVVQHYVVEEREKRKIRDAFGLYLTPHHARLVSERPEMLKLGGDTRELTVLFSDIRGFTTISEQFQSQPHVLVELLNEFLGSMTDVIFAHEGTLDKYVGDEIMAVWGAPIPQQDHAARACRAALGMGPRLQELNAHWRQRGWPALSIGIGLNTGPMVVGNMGSARRLSYTVIGDNVNLGARLEGLNKLYGGAIIASETTVQAADGVLVARELDMVRVKGKRLPVRIFEILAPAGDRAQWQWLVEQFAAGIMAYRERRWDEACAVFGAILERRPDDGPARLYRERCRELAARPPGPEWDAVTTMDVK
jgi:adenylate cyclase